MTTKQCKECKRVKPLDAFHKQTGGKYGVWAVCKTCRAEKRNHPVFVPVTKLSEDRLTAYRYEALHPVCSR